MTTLTRRTFTAALGASAAGTILAGRAWAAERERATPPGRGAYPIRNGSVITADLTLGTLPRADVLVRAGVIEKVGLNLAADRDVEVIDANGMIVMPGMIDTHYHMWSTISRNYLTDGVEYFEAKGSTSAFYTPEDFYNSVTLGLAELASGGVTTVHNWAHNARSPAHVDAELRAHRDSMLRARYSQGHIDQLDPATPLDFTDIERVKRDWFGSSSPFEGLIHQGVNVRSAPTANEDVVHVDIGQALKRGFPVSIHAAQAPPNNVNVLDFERRGYLGPKFLIAHYIPGQLQDFEAMARSSTPLSFAVHSELRLGVEGDARSALMRMRQAGLAISLSSDATSLARPDMLEAMRFVWNLGVPWQGTPSAKQPPMGFGEVIRMATINGARALGIDHLTGSLTPGKRADLVLIDTNQINIAPIGVIEATVVMFATPANVDTVMVDGRIIKRAGKLTTYDVPRIVAAAKASSALRIRRQAGKWLTPAPEPGRFMGGANDPGR